MEDSIPFLGKKRDASFEDDEAVSQTTKQKQKRVAFALAEDDIGEAVSAGEPGSDDERKTRTGFWDEPHLAETEMISQLIRSQVVSEVEIAAQVVDMEENEEGSLGKFDYEEEAAKNDRQAKAADFDSLMQSMPELTMREEHRQRRIDLLEKIRPLLKQSETGLAYVPRWFQIEALRRILDASGRGGVLSLEPGAGKTLVVLMVMLVASMEGEFIASSSSLMIISGRYSSHECMIDFFPPHMKGSLKELAFQAAVRRPNQPIPEALFHFEPTISFQPASRRDGYERAAKKYRTLSFVIYFFFFSQNCGQSSLVYQSSHSMLASGSFGAAVDF